MVKATGKRKTIPLYVRISDINDNTPRFIDLPYVASVPEVCLFILLSFVCLFYLILVFEKGFKIKFSFVKMFTIFLCQYPEKALSFQ